MDRLSCASWSQQQISQQRGKNNIFQQALGNFTAARSCGVYQ